MHRPGNKVVLVHGIELPEMSIQNARERYVSPAVLASMWKEEETKCKALENKMKLLIKDQDVSARLRSHVGKPGEVICHFAVEENAAFIVIGARGVSALKRAVLGTVSDYVLRHAHCPVVVCRDPGEVERRRRRHASADSSHVMSKTDLLNQQESDDKVRHKSGEPFTRLASGLRRRFASGTGGRAARSVDISHSPCVDFEKTTVLYPDPDAEDPASNVALVQQVSNEL